MSCLAAPSTGPSTGSSRYGSWRSGGSLGVKYAGARTAPAAGVGAYSVARISSARRVREATV